MKNSTTPEQWVARAAAKRSSKREYLECVHVLDGVMYASDGIRLHFTQTLFPNGTYSPTSFTPVKIKNHIIRSLTVVETFQMLIWRLNVENAVRPTLSLLRIGHEGIPTLKHYATVNGGYSYKAVCQAVNNNRKQIVAIETCRDPKMFGTSKFGGFLIALIKNVKN